MSGEDAARTTGGQIRPCTIRSMEPGELVLLLVVVGLVGLVLWLRTDERSQSVFALPCSPPECVEDATAYMVQRGYAVAHKSDTTATFTRPKAPRADVGCLLLLLGIIPGLLYFGLFKGTYTVSLVAVPGEGGTQLLISGDDHTGRQVLAQWARPS